MDPFIPSHLKAAAILLISGWVIFWIGALTPPYKWWMGIPVRDYLTMIAEHRTTWLFIAGVFTIGVLLTLAGFVVLGIALRESGDRVWSELGQAAFLFGALLWIASIAFRATATVAAAKETVASGIVPPWFEPMRDWSGAIFAVYMVLAYLATAAFGKALLDTGVAPSWIAWTHVVFGLAGAVGFLVRFPLFDPPLMVHLVPGVLGIVLLVRG